MQHDRCVLGMLIGAAVAVTTQLVLVHVLKRGKQPYWQPEQPNRQPEEPNRQPDVAEAPVEFSVSPTRQGPSSDDLAME